MEKKVFFCCIAEFGIGFIEGHVRNCLCKRSKQSKNETPTQKIFLYIFSKYLSEFSIFFAGKMLLEFNANEIKITHTYTFISQCMKCHTNTHEQE